MAQIRAKTKSFPEHAICPKEPAVVQGAAGALGGFSGAPVAPHVSQVTRVDNANNYCCCFEAFEFQVAKMAEKIANASTMGPIGKQ